MPGGPTATSQIVWYRAEAARRHSGLFVPRQFFVVRNGLDLNYFRSSDDTLETRTYVASCGVLVAGQALGPIAKSGSKGE